MTTHMVGAHLNLNGSRDLITPLLGIVCHPRASTCYLHTKFKVPISTQYKDMKGNKNVENRVVWGSYGHSAQWK